MTERRLTAGWWPPMSAMAVWTLIVWVGRVRNVVNDQALSEQGRTLRVALALSFVGLAVALGVAIAAQLRNPSSALSAGSLPARSAVAVLAFALAAWTIVVWVVRGLDIAVDQQFDLGFRVVHSALALVSIALAAWAVRSLTAWRPVHR